MQEEKKTVFLSKPERFFRNRPLLYSVATYRKLALMSAGKDSNRPCLVYGGGVHPPGCASWLDERGRERREEAKLCTCQEHGRQVCPSLGVGQKGSLLLFFLVCVHF